MGQTVTGCLTAECRWEVVHLDRDQRVRRGIELRRAEDLDVVSSGDVDFSQVRESQGRDHRIGAEERVGVEPTMSEDKIARSRGLGPKLEVKDVKDISNTCP